MRRYYALAFFILFGDQLSKSLVATHLRVGEVIELGTYVNLRHSENRGAAFSFLADAGGWQRFVLSGIALMICGWIAWLLRRRLPTMEAVGLSLVLGGALGNLVDRVRLGHVVDFIDLHWAGHHWPTFNVADIGIVAGVAGLVVHGAAFGGRARGP